MDLIKSLRQIGRMLFRRLLNTGINRGLDHLARGGSARGTARDDLTPGEQAHRKRARDLAKRARKAARLTRRIGRF